MAILLELNYGKKLGLPEYSSHHFDVSLKAEVADLRDIEGEVERVYRILQDSVDAQITHPGFIPGQPSPVAIDSHDRSWNCSEKQQALILKIVAERKLNRNEVDELAIERFGRGVTSLNKLQASGLIDELLEKRSRPPLKKAA